MNNKITFNKDKIKKLTKTYRMAIKLKKDIFLFEKQKILTSYAHYLIEYLNTKIK